MSDRVTEARTHLIKVVVDYRATAGCTDRQMMVRRATRLADVGRAVDALVEAVQEAVPSDPLQDLRAAARDFERSLDAYTEAALKASPKKD